MSTEFEAHDVTVLARYLEQARQRRERQEQRARSGDNSLARDLVNLLDDLGVAGTVNYNLTTIGEYTFRASRASENDRSKLQILGRCLDCDEQVWSTHFTTIEEMEALTHRFKDGPEHQKECEAANEFGRAMLLLREVRCLRRALERAEER